MSVAVRSGTVAIAAEPPAMGAAAASLYNQGLERFAARDYPAAIADFEAGFALEPRREFLFAEAQAKRLGGDCPGAVALYQRFLATDPAPVQRNATEMALGRCAQHLAEHPKIVLVTPPPAPAPATPPAPPPRWWRDPIGVGLAIGALASVGLGVGFLAASYAARDDAGQAMTLADYDGRWATAESRRTTATIALSVGGLLTAGTVTRFVLVRRRAKAPRGRAGPDLSLSVGVATIAVRGGF